MIRYGLILLFAAVNCGWGALVTAPRKGVEGNRFLFIVDTSSSMKRIEEAGRPVAYDLIYSGIEQRMQPGDTFGLWTFSDDIKGGVFPVQEWSPEKSGALATEVSNFLKEQMTRRASRLDNAITNVERLVKSVRDVDIVIVTCAATRLKMDDSWAMLTQGWKARVDEAKKNNKPLIVTLAGRGGQIRQATVALPGERLQLAAPPDRKAAPMAKGEPKVQPFKPTREPIILRGKQNGRPIDEIPTRFAPPPAAEPPAIETAPEPSPVPVVGPDKPIVSAPANAQLTVAAREPGKSPAAAPAQSPAIGARMLIIVGVTLMVVAGILGVFAFVHFRARRVSYISQSMAQKPPEPS